MKSGWLWVAFLFEDYGWVAKLIWEVRLVEGGFVSSSLLVAVVALEVLHL